MSAGKTNAMEALITPVAIKQQHGQAGFKLFEFALAAAIFAIVVTLLLQRISFYQGEAEQVALQQVVANVRSALAIKLAQGRLPGQQLDLTMLTEENPLAWLSDQPANYLGEYFAPSEQALAAGNWYFDRREKMLVYLLNNRNIFVGSSVKRLKFKVKLLRLPKNSAKPPGTSDFDGVAFEQVYG